jgi:hypothetical protein
MEPVDVFEIAGKLLLVNGWHRWHAHEQAGKGAIVANVHTGGTFMKWSNEGLARYKKQYLHLDIAEIGRMALELGLIHRDEIDLFLNPQYFSELDLVDSRLRSLSQFIAQKRAKLGS